MYEAFGDFWGSHLATIGGSDRPHYYCITTNGTVKTNGLAVMGRGIALQAAQRFPALPYLLGVSLRHHGNRVVSLGTHLSTSRVPYDLIAFPVKHHWDEIGTLRLIEQSAIELAAIARWLPDAVFLLPQPGCGSGQLKWADVQPLITCSLPNNVYAVNRVLE